MMSSILMSLMCCAINTPPLETVNTFLYGYFVRRKTLTWPNPMSEHLHYTIATQDFITWYKLYSYWLTCVGIGCVIPLLSSYLLLNHSLFPHCCQKSFILFSQFWILSYSGLLFPSPIYSLPSHDVNVIISYKRYCFEINAIDLCSLCTYDFLYQLSSILTWHITPCINSMDYEKITKCCMQKFFSWTGLKEFSPQANLY